MRSALAILLALSVVILGSVTVSAADPKGGVSISFAPSSPGPSRWCNACTLITPRLTPIVVGMTLPPTDAEQ